MRKLLALALAVATLVCLGGTAPAGAARTVNTIPIASFVVVSQKKNTMIINTSASHDPDGVIYGWSWDGGAGDQWEINPVPKKPDLWKLVYANAGTFVLSLVVVDNLGGISLPFTQVVHPGAIAPRAKAVLVATRWSGDPADPATAVLDGSQSGAGITDYEWSFDDGQSASGQTIEHAFASPGNHTATLTVTDGNGVSSSSTVKIKKIPANVGATLKVKNSVAKLTVKVPKKGYYSVQNLTVDWGDGTPSELVSGKSVSHTYAAPGTYSLALSYMLVAPAGCQAFCGPFTMMVHETAVVTA